MRVVLERYGAVGRLGVACSGGPDSAVLADAAMALHRRGVVGPVTLLHVDHGLREQSADEANVVAALAGAGGGQLVRLRVDVDRERASLEGAARDARYAALDSAATELGLQWVLTAHTASDQAETVLMRIMRGTGVAGLRGIPERRGVYLRPLLSTGRDEVVRYVTAARLDVVADPMNADPAHLRVRIRARWLPDLRGENPSIDAALCRLAVAAGETSEAIDIAARRLIDASGELVSGELTDVPDAIAKRAITFAAGAAGLTSLGAAHLDALLDLVRRPEAGTIRVDLPGGHALREYGDLRFIAWETSEISESSQIRVSGRDGPYLVRAWQPGDRMRPQRLRGRSRKLSDLYGAAKVPRDERPRARVVVRQSDEVVVWAEHVGNAYECEVDVTLTTRARVAK